MRGVTLPELAVVLCLVTVLTGIALPRGKYVLDWIAVENAAAEISTLHAVAREVAVLKGMRSRFRIAADSLRVELVTPDSAMVYLRRPGPSRRGVTLTVSVPVLEFHPTGIGRGATNTRVVLTRGKASVTLTNSRLGRLKRRS